MKLFGKIKVIKIMTVKDLPEDSFLLAAPQGDNSIHISGAIDGKVIEPMFMVLKK